MVSCRPLSDAEKRLLEAAMNGKCDEIRVLSQDGTDMSYPDPNYVRNTWSIHYYKEIGRIWLCSQPADLLRRMTTMQLETNTGTSAR